MHSRLSVAQSIRSVSHFCVFCFANDDDTGTLNRMEIEKKIIFAQAVVRGWLVRRKFKGSFWGVSDCVTFFCSHCLLFSLLSAGFVGQEARAHDPRTARDRKVCFVLVDHSLAHKTHTSSMLCVCVCVLTSCQNLRHRSWHSRRQLFDAARRARRDAKGIGLFLFGSFCNKNITINMLSLRR